MVKSVTEIKGSTDNHSKRLILSYEFPGFYKYFISVLWLLLTVEIFSI